MNFDFDAWVRLAKENPQEFERRRRIALRVVIEGASSEHRKRLQALQRDIDREREQTSLASCVRIDSPMWAGFFRLRKELGRLHAKPASPTSAQGDPAPGTTARVIPLRARSTTRVS